MDVDLQDMPLKELRELHKKINREIEEYEVRQREKTTATVQKAAEKHGFSLKDSLGNAPKKIHVHGEVCQPG